MNAHIKLPKAMQAEVDRQKEENHEKVFRECADDILVQSYAAVFWTMSTRFGWKEKRLKQLAEALHDTMDMMCNPSRLHHRFSPLDCEKEIKEKFGIDLRKEFKAEVEVKP